VSNETIEAWISKDEREGSLAYEAPTIAIIGPLSKITLGSGGTMNDGFNMKKH
jgi:hypothetical protein